MNERLKLVSDTQYMFFGAPNILQSDNGAEFTVSNISQLKDLWPKSFMGNRDTHKARKVFSRQTQI
jgi:hypothetical protein